MLTAYEQTPRRPSTRPVSRAPRRDSASNTVYGNETSPPVTVDELLPLTRAVARTIHRALAVGDLRPAPTRAHPSRLATAVRFMKEGGAHGVSPEGGRETTPQI